MGTDLSEQVCRSHVLLSRARRGSSIVSELITRSSFLGHESAQIIVRETGYSARLGRNLRSGPPRAVREECPVFESRPMTDGPGFALLRFLLGGAAMTMPLRVVSYSSIRFTTMRSYKGRRFILSGFFPCWSLNGLAMRPGDGAQGRCAL